MHIINKEGHDSDEINLIRFAKAAEEICVIVGGNFKIFSSVHCNAPRLHTPYLFICLSWKMIDK